MGTQLQKAYDDAAEIQRLHTHDEFKDAEIRARIDENRHHLSEMEVSAMRGGIIRNPVIQTLSNVFKERIAELEAQLNKEKV